ncbi:hypothetical protein K490DRAFT_41820 [Saccharata proteae CBS 121410]|uniref:Transglutaminase-like domain-containing protein n=1 Tax=Saccharata proteae CBS 121410 TaxID=1314787 RepID=A0A9P4HWS0_9PEZI|nr:hypothetical protein K490DRAFT_41820 [Saccharata proteae CBS 121410]
MPSLKARIAALNIQEVAKPASPPPTYGQATAGAKKRPPPPPPSAPPPRLSSDARSQTTNNPPLASNGHGSSPQVGNQPRGAAPDRPSLPPRPSQRSVPQTPSLPPRRPSSQSIQRKESAESISTVASGRSSISAFSGRTSLSTSSDRVKAPPFDPSKLPPLPPKRSKEEQDMDYQKYNRAGGKFQPKPRTPSTPTPSQPPSLPERPALPSRPATTQPPKPRRSALEWGLNKSTETAPVIPASRPGLPAPRVAPNEPPPIPLSSRPDLAALQASKPRANASSTGTGGSCLKCRDFHAVDAHAARFPRQSIPSTDITWLATQLTSPFPSLTDKARALFAWLHYNVAYDTVSFFNNNVQPSTPSKTIATGLAVCEGYAGLFFALATAVGLEAVVVGGHGKGYGHTDLAPGSPVPPFSCGHAWNAVRIDNGQWKLIDCCWGAGQLVNNTYRQNLAEEQFTMDNDEFGLSHFPENPRYFFRNDGRQSISWQEYITSPPTVQVFGDAAKNGLSKTSFSPSTPTIAISDPSSPTVRFQFSKKCPHWSSEAAGLGKPFLFLIQVHGGGVDGQKTEYLPMQSDGYWWWCDVERRKLGRRGQKIHVAALTKWQDQSEDSARGVTREMYEGNPYGMRAFGFLAGWDLV